MISREACTCQKWASCMQSIFHLVVPGGKKLLSLDSSSLGSWLDGRAESFAFRSQVFRVL